MWWKMINLTLYTPQLNWMFLFTFKENEWSESIIIYLYKSPLLIRLEILTSFVFKKAVDENFTLQYRQEDKKGIALQFSNAKSTLLHTYM